MKKIPAGVGNRGFTLLEMAVVLAALALVSTAAIPFFIRQAETTAAQKTAKEISTIQEAAKWYYINNKAWPGSIGVLQSAGFLNPSWSAGNPWGVSYSVSAAAGSFTVTTWVPTSVTGVLSRALPGVSASGGTVSSVIPVPGQEASLTSVTNLANTALSLAQSSALPPYGGTSYLSLFGFEQNALICPAGYVAVGINQESPATGGTVRGVYCQRIAR